MDIVTAITTIGKFLLDVLQEMRKSFPQKDRLDRIRLGSLIELYGVMMKLEFHTNNLAEILDKNHKIETKKLKELFNFIEHVLIFSEKLRNLNILILDIYYPGLANKLFNVRFADQPFIDYFYEEAVPKYNINPDNMPKNLRIFVKNFDVDRWRPERHLEQELWRLRGPRSFKIINGKTIDTTKTLSHDKLPEALQSLIIDLRECCSIIRYIVTTVPHFLKLLLINNS